MQIVCPNCRNACVIDAEPAIGQHILCPFCSEKFLYSGGEQCAHDEDAEVVDEEPVASTGGLRIVGMSKSSASEKKVGHAKLSLADSGIIKIMMGVFNGAKIDGWLTMLAINLWWWFGNVLLTIVFIWSLIKLSAFDDAMSMLESMLGAIIKETNGANGIAGDMIKSNINLGVSAFVYLFLMLVWLFAIWTHWVIYKIAIGVFKTVACLASREEA